MSVSKIGSSAGIAAQAVRVQRVGRHGVEHRRPELLVPAQRLDHVRERRNSWLRISLLFQRRLDYASNARSSSYETITLRL